MKGTGFSATSLFPLLLLAALLVLGLVGWRAVDARAGALDAARLLDECQRLAAQIKSARGGPTKAEENRRTEEELAGQIEGWCRASSIDAKQIVRIEPLQPRRVEESSYVVQGAHVQLKSVTLPQLASFADQLGGAEVNLSVSALRLTAPRVEQPNNQAGEAWQGELTLTYLVYSPKGSR